MSVTRISSRYYCTATAHHRVFPFDGFDRLTEGPALGKSGEAVLLTSLNNGLAADDLRWAWCWSCDKWMQCYRRTQHEVMRDYLSRPGVSIRNASESVEGKRLLTMIRAASRNGQRKR